MWLVREVLRAWVEIMVILGGTVVIFVTLATLVVVQNRRRPLRVDEAAKAHAIAQRAAVPAAPVRVNVAVNVNVAAPAPAPAAPQYVTHNHLHLHGIPRGLAALAAGWRRGSAAMDDPGEVEAAAIAARKVVPGEVLGADAPAEIEAPKAPLYRISEQPVIKESK